MGLTQLNWPFLDYNAWSTIILRRSDRYSMKETTPTAMPPCFLWWCKQFDDCWKNSPQKTGFRHPAGWITRGK